ncbi:protein crossbronx [Dichotomopilus funicola]|uniref:Protein crossbronx n=1 Tax=Dichotomopilus funicola TaxID=1934379 RepID=A0AAN6V9C5_9PEZI|nr:protein crossbronx [Dichotomopilus funicola]
MSSSSLSAPPGSAKISSLSSVKRQHLLTEFAGLKQACPQGIYVSLTQGDPTLWSGVLFVRKGPYAPAILRFHISFPDTYPSLPPLVTFSTDMFHPLLTPLTTYMYSTDVQDGGTASAFDEERLPPGGFSLRHGFAGWFGRGGRAVSGASGGSGGVAVGGGSGSGSGGGKMMLRTPTRPVATATGTTPVSVAASATSAASAAAASVASSSASMPGYARPGRPKEVSTYEVLRYIRSAFDDEDVLDAVPLEAAGNPGAWHAWRTHRRQQQTAGTGKPLPVPGSGSASASSAVESGARTGAETTARRPNEWNWEGVWEERVKRGVAASLSEGVLFGHAGTADEVINFLSMDDAEIEGAKSNLLRTLGAAA